jgi:hypothetical protein
MTRFSSRFGYDPRVPKEAILEDAPEWVRIPYLNGILQPITFTDSDSRYSNDENRPLGIKALYGEYCRIAREDPDNEAYDSWHCWDYLKSALRGTAWYYFYDFVEYVGQALKKCEEDLIYVDEWMDRFGFVSYQRQVNQLFSEERIGWRLSDESELLREIPKPFNTLASLTSSSLKDGLAPARQHFQKARRYIFERPVDPENGIKEILSALESAGRAEYPKAKTLGDVLHETSRKKTLPPLLTAMMEKFYGYASAEPAVRHGSPVPSKVSLADAEFCFYLGMAFIRYFLAKTKAG